MRTALAFVVFVALAAGCTTALPTATCTDWHSVTRVSTQGIPVGTAEICAMRK